MNTKFPPIHGEGCPPSQPNELDLLAYDWREAKRQEDAAREHRIRVEQRIIAEIGVKDEGSQTTSSRYFKVTTTGKLSRTLDVAKWEEISNLIPPQYRPVRYVPEINLKALRTLESMPQTYAIFAQALTVKPAKPSVTIEEL